MMSQRPFLMLNPARDADFERIAQALKRTVTTPRELQAGLRDVHPKAVVNPREISGEFLTVWYVYREGHWVRD